MFMGCYVASSEIREETEECGVLPGYVEVLSNVCGLCVCVCCVYLASNSRFSIDAMFLIYMSVSLI